MDISNISAMYQNYNQTAAGSATGNQISQLQGKDMSQATDEELMEKFFPVVDPVLILCLRLFNRTLTNIHKCTQFFQGISDVT